MGGLFGRKRANIVDSRFRGNDIAFFPATGKQP